MDLGLGGKRAMILGGSRGIGWYTARLLAEEGCSVALCARGADRVSQAIETLGGHTSGNHFGAAADLSDGHATRAFVSKAIAPRTSAATEFGVMSSPPKRCTGQVAAVD